MKSVNIILADDLENIHEAIHKTFDSINRENTNCKYDIIKDFYDTDSLVKFLRRQKESQIQPDVLLLDHEFKGNGKNGLDVIPSIRECMPWLPIIMLTAYDDNLFDDVLKKFKVDYINKPAKATDLRFRIKSIIQTMDAMENIQEKILENKDFLEYLMEENERLSQELFVEQSNAVEQSLPMTMRELIGTVFSDVEFLPKSFRLLAKSNVKQGDWIRMFRCLKAINWKDEIQANGINTQRYYEGKKDGYEDVWEYRFSKAGRIFADMRKGKLPLIVLIDPSHKYDKLPHL